ncbi:hypothetical protein HDV00_000883 [Rhizophlyctis rosea]|nr:hypothetical protein HDV00_000883 [Rhizophlyctis rosea]
MARASAPSRHSAEAMVSIMRQLSIIDPQVPAHHEEYRTAFPKEKKHYEHLKETFNLEAALSFGEKCMERDSDLGTIYLLKRWGELSPNLLSFLASNPPFGAIFERSRDVECTYAGPRQSFSNMLSAKVNLAGGDTHLAVGFVDLSILLHSDIRKDAAPITFVGIDMCPYAIAKTAVIKSMLELRHEPEAIVQVWVSSGWDQLACQRFKEGTESALAEITMGLVRQILQHWKNAPAISVQTARRQWFQQQDTEDPSELSSNLTSKTDRVQVARYEMTGEFLNYQTPVTGNITMFSVLPDAAPLARNENIFYVLPMMELVKTDRKSSFVSLGWKYMVEKVGRLAALVSQQGGRVPELRSELMLGKMDGTQDVLLNKLKALHPATVSWNNVLDYMAPSNFHRMARRISVDGTIPDIR